MQPRYEGIPQTSRALGKKNKRDFMSLRWAEHSTKWLAIVVSHKVLLPAGSFL